MSTSKTFTRRMVHSIHHISCPIEIDLDAISDFEKSSIQWIKMPNQIHVLDFKNVKLLDKTFLKVLSQIRLDIAKISSRFASVNASDEIQKIIAGSGLEKDLGVIKNPMFSQITGVLKTESPPQLDTLEVQTWLIRCFVEATRAAMNTMFNTTVAADENYREPIKTFDFEKVDRIAAIDTASSFLQAQFRLYFSDECLSRLARASVQLPPGPVDPEILESTATELLNLIYGPARSKLKDGRNFEIPSAIPKLVTKDQVRLSRNSRMNQLILLPMATAVGTFYMEIDIRNT